MPCSSPRVTFLRRSRDVRSCAKQPRPSWRGRADPKQGNPVQLESADHRSLLSSGSREREPSLGSSEENGPEGRHNGAAAQGPRATVPLPLCSLCDLDHYGNGRAGLASMSNTPRSHAALYDIICARPRDGKAAMRGIADWLASIGLAEYAQCFADNAIDLSIVHDLTEQDLKDLGVLLGHRRKMLRAIAELEPSDISPAKSPTKPISREEAERRYLTVMFCDLVDSSALTRRLDPEDMRRVIESYHTCVGEVLGRHQGTIARFMGDGVLTYFGYPRAREDDAQRAVRAALALVEAVAQLRTSVDGVLQARVSIATGTVVVSALLIDDTLAEQAVVGEAPNLAARLQSLADPETVLICPSTRQLAGELFNYRYIGPLALKGWAEPMPAWQVLGASGVESGSEVMHKSKPPTLYGREEEIELLLRRWRHATLGEGRVVMLTGEAGIGKSHIARAFDERLHGEAHVTLRYFCSAHHTNSALFPFSSQLERAAGFERGDSP